MELKIKGKKYPLRVTLGAQLMFKEDLGKEVPEMEGIEDFSYYLFCCSKSASIADGITFDITFEEFVNSFDQEMLDQWEVLQADYIEKKTKRMTRQMA